MLKLRPYQSRIIEDTIKELNNYRKPFVVDCYQASGKSVMIAELVKQYGQPTLILCMNKELVEQDADKLRGIGVDATIYCASAGSKVISNVTVATINSIYKNPEYCGHFGLVIIDECDQLPCDNAKSMYMKLLTKITTKVVGWTGTPFRAIKKTRFDEHGEMYSATIIRTLNRIPMGNQFFWGKIIHGISYKELLDEKHVAPIKYFVEKTDMSMLQVNSTGMDYTEKSLERYMEQNLHNITRCTIGAVRSLKPKRTLVTVSTIEDATHIAEQLKEAGIKAEVLHSQIKKKDRTNIINRYRAGDIEVVVQVMILNVGFDLPALDLVIFARPCLSLRIWGQTVARAIRKDPEDDNKLAKVVDLTDMIKKFGRIESIRLGKDSDGFRDVVLCDHGIISDKVLSEFNISQVQRKRIEPKL